MSDDELAEFEMAVERATTGPWEAGARFLVTHMGTVKGLIRRVRDLEAALAVERPKEYPCQVCGRPFDAAHLFDLKGNVPGGCKLTCAECCGRLEERAGQKLLDTAVKVAEHWHKLLTQAVADEREACAKVAEAVAEECYNAAGSLYATAGGARAEEVAGRIRSRSRP